MEAFSKNLKSVTADFSQSVTDANGHRGDDRKARWRCRRRGSSVGKRSSRIEQTIVADGQRVWVYEPDLQQVSVRSQSGEEAHSPLTVLTDLGAARHGVHRERIGRARWPCLAQARFEGEGTRVRIRRARLLGAGRSIACCSRISSATPPRYASRDWKRNPSMPGDDVQVHAAEGRRRDRQHRSGRRGFSGEELSASSGGSAWLHAAAHAAPARIAATTVRIDIARMRSAPSGSPAAPATRAATSRHRATRRACSRRFGKRRSR